MALVLFVGLVLADVGLDFAVAWVVFKLFLVTTVCRVDAREGFDLEVKVVSAPERAVGFKTGRTEPDRPDSVRTGRTEPDRPDSVRTGRSPPT
jgi:hypothetical protein